MDDRSTLRVQGLASNQSESSTDCRNFVFVRILKRSFRHVYKLLFKQQSTTNKYIRAGVNNLFMQLIIEACDRGTSKSKPCR